MFDLEAIVRPHIREMAPYEPILPFEVLSRQLGRPVSEIIKLDANENPYGPLPEVRQALGELEYIHIYPDPESRDLRQALAEYHGLPAENLIAGAGADELIDLLMRLLLEPGEAMINCPPTFGMYSFDGAINRAKVINIPRSPDFNLDIEGIEDAVRGGNAKLIFLANPNNPDGGLLDPELLERLLALPLLVVLDEAYIEFASPGSSQIRRVPSMDNLVVLRTFSKWAGLAGLRVGYGAFPDWMAPYLWKIKQPYNISIAAATAAEISLKYAPKLEDVGAKIIAERGRLFAGLKKFPWLQPYPSQANFILCRVSGRDAAELKARMAGAGILVRHFAKPGLQDHIRISVGRPEETDRLMEILRAI